MTADAGWSLLYTLLVCLLTIPIYLIGEGVRRRIVRRRRERR